MKFTQNKKRLKKYKIQMPESLRIWLIDDFDFIIQQNKIFNLPSKKSIRQILDDYIDYKVKKKYMNEWDLIDEDKEKENEKYITSMNETVSNCCPKCVVKSVCASTRVEQCASIWCASISICTCKALTRAHMRMQQPRKARSGIPTWIDSDLAQA